MRATRNVVLLGLLTAVASVIGQASAASPAGTTVHCSWHAHTKGPYRYKGTIVGSVVCSRPLGKGSYRERYRDNITLPTGSETGSSKLSFKAGSVRGTYVLPAATVSGTADYPGTFHITGGSGHFTHLSGTLHMRCHHLVPPTEDCTASGIVTGI